MRPDDASSIPTRRSLLEQMKSGKTEGWTEFYCVYGRLINNMATQAGLNPADAEEVLQETALALTRHLPGFEYNPKVCRFKTWLLNQASWRIKDQIKRRNRDAKHLLHSNASEDTSRTSTANRIPDPALQDLDAALETEWRKNLLERAFERIKQKFRDKQLQMFDLLVNQQWTPREVGESLGVSVANVYVTKHRIAAALTREIKRLEAQLEHEAAEQVRVKPARPGRALPQ